MSAGISYSALTSYGKATLPSAEGWGSNLNILRDPPKSVTTRRVDKVFDDLSIVQTIADSRDRFCDHINVYARGVNPMVSVSYNNTKGRQAKLPYNVMDAGAFRPPSQRPHDLLPLTRLPRLVTSAYAQPTNIDPTRKVISNCSKDDVRADPIRTQSVIPIYSNPMSKSAEAPYDVKYTIIDDPLRVASKPTTAPQNTKNIQITENFSIIRHDTLHPELHLNKESVRSTQNSNVHTDHYLQDKLRGEVRTNRNNSQVSLLDLNGDVMHYTKDPLHYQYNTHKTNVGAKGTEHMDVRLSKNVPVHEYTAYKTNMGAKGTEHIDVRLSKNVPVHQYTAYKTNVGAKGTEHMDVRLSKNLPMYEAVSHQSDPNRFVRHAQPEHQLGQNRPTVNINTKHVPEGLTKMNNFESRDYSLKNTISLNNNMTPGGYTPTMLRPDTNSDKLLPSLSTKKSTFREKVSAGFMDKITRN